MGCRSGGCRAELPGDSDASGGGGWWAADEEGPGEGQVLKWDVAATLMRPCLPICPSPSLLARPGAAAAGSPGPFCNGVVRALVPFHRLVFYCQFIIRYFFND